MRQGWCVVAFEMSYCVSHTLDSVLTATLTRPIALPYSVDYLAGETSIHHTGEERARGNASCSGRPSQILSVREHGTVCQLTGVRQNSIMVWTRLTVLRGFLQVTTRPPLHSQRTHRVQCQASQTLPSPSRCPVTRSAPRLASKTLPSRPLHRPLSIYPL